MKIIMFVFMMLGISHEVYAAEPRIPLVKARSAEKLTLRFHKMGLQDFVAKTAIIQQLANQRLTPIEIKTRILAQIEVYKNQIPEAEKVTAAGRAKLMKVGGLNEGQIVRVIIGKNEEAQTYLNLYEMSELRQQQLQEAAHD